IKTYSAEECTWRAPVPSPSKVICLALNNRALDRIKIRAPTDHPAFFLKPSTAVTGHFCPIRLRASFGLTHPEPELGVVIAQTLKDVSPAAALDGIFGYTIVNDITSVGMGGGGGGRPCPACAVSTPHQRRARPRSAKHTRPIPADTRRATHSRRWARGS